MCDGSGHGGVRVRHVDPQERGHHGPVGPSVEGQDHRVADTDLTVADGAVLDGHPCEFLAVEGVGDEVEQRARVVGDHPRRNAGVTLGRRVPHRSRPFVRSLDATTLGPNEDNRGPRSGCADVEMNVHAAVVATPSVCSGQRREGRVFRGRISRRGGCAAGHHRTDGGHHRQEDRQALFDGTRDEVDRGGLGGRRVRRRTGQRRRHRGADRRARRVPSIAPPCDCPLRQVSLRQGRR